MPDSPVSAGQSIIARFIDVSDKGMRHKDAFYLCFPFCSGFPELGGGVSRRRFTTSSNGMGLGLGTGFFVAIA